MRPTSEQTEGVAARAASGPPRDAQRDDLAQVVEYWNTHLNATQFLEGRPLEEGSVEFFDAVESSYERFGYKRPLFDWMATLPGKRLLEIGCGLGNDLCELARRGLDVTGIDIAPKAVEMTRRHLTVRGLPGTAEVQNCESLTLGDETFDIVYSSGVIQHTANLQAAVQEIFRVLRPGGTVVIVLYHRYSWFRFLARLSGTHVEFADRDAPIIRSFSRRELRRMFSTARDLRITMEHFRPQTTVRKGPLSGLFNRVFVPAYNLLPEALIRPFGWHAVVTGRK